MCNQHLSDNPFSHPRSLSNAVHFHFNLEFELLLNFRFSFFSWMHNRSRSCGWMGMKCEGIDPFSYMHFFPLFYVSLESQPKWAAVLLLFDGYWMEFELLEAQKGPFQTKNSLKVPSTDSHLFSHSAWRCHNLAFMPGSKFAFPIVLAIIAFHFQMKISRDFRHMWDLHKYRRDFCCDRC